VTRLIDMGVEPFLVASSLEGVMAQRLVRRVCAECGEWHEPHRAELPADLPAGLRLGPGDRLRRGRGCRACRMTGFKGRVGVYELMGLPEAVREVVNRRASAPEVAAAAIGAGALSRLIEDGLAKVRAGLTTPDEVLSAMSE
jgi:type II secretory ATPase GspE/PulE/Tfp pilus assembly ATPase PilB-like protein